MTGALGEGRLKLYLVVTGALGEGRPQLYLGWIFVTVRECLGKHLCMRFSFLVAIPNSVLFS